MRANIIRTGASRTAFDLLSCPLASGEAPQKTSRQYPRGAGEEFLLRPALCIPLSSFSQTTHLGFNPIVVVNIY